MAKKRRPKPQPGPAAKRRPAGTGPATPPEPDPITGYAGGEDHPFVRHRVAILVGFTVVGLLGALLVGLALQSREQYSCKGTDVPAATTTAGTERGALDRLLDTTPALPRDGWASSEPNRFARSVEGSTMIVNVSQSDDGTFQAVRYDVCGFGIS